MSDEMSAADFNAMQAKKPSKYRNVKVEVDGYKFDSKAEAERYWHLKLLQDAGEISNLELQVEYPLFVQGVKIGAYRCDFRYTDADGKVITEDVKGVKTPLYNWKKKHLKAQTGIEIVEIVRGRAA